MRPYLKNKSKRGGVCLKWWSTCLASTRPWLQNPSITKIICQIPRNYPGPFWYASVTLLFCGINKRTFNWIMNRGMLAIFCSMWHCKQPIHQWTIMMLCVCWLWIKRSSQGKPVMVFFRWDCGLNSVLCTCKADTLPHQPCLWPILVWLFWRWGLTNYLPHLASNLDSPDLLPSS
jgi:hypothetical protein